MEGENFSPRSTLNFEQASKVCFDEVLELVMSCWKSVLKTSNVKASDNFFLLGGNSILLLQVRGKLERDHAISVPVRKFFQHLTAMDLASEISKTFSVDNRLRSQERYEPFPLTDVQRAYWIGRNADMGLGGVSAHGYIEIDCTNTDLDRLETAINKVIERHDMLRVVVQPDGYQRVLKQVPWYAIRKVDFRGKNADIVTLALHKIRNNLSHQVLNIEVWPSFDIRASILANDVTRIHISHEIIFCDAWSFTLIWKEINQIYDQPSLILPQLLATFRDYVCSELCTHDTLAHQQAESFWLQRIEKLPPPPSLPLLVNPANSGRHTFTRFQGVLSKDDWKMFKTNCARCSVTPSVGLLAAFLDVLAAFSSQTDMALTLTVFNRSGFHPQIDAIVGDFTTVVVIGIDAVRKSFRERAAIVQNEVWEALDHRRISGIKVLRMLAKSHGQDFAVLPVVFTSLIGQIGAAFREGGHGKQVYSISQTPQIYFDHQVYEVNGRLCFNWDVVDSLFPDGFISKMLDRYICWLKYLGNYNNWINFKRDFIPKVDKEIISLSNDTYRDIKYQRLEQLFMASAAATPDSIALICSDRSLSYGELRQLADTIAHDLQVAGTNRGDVIGVLAEPGWEQIAAVLGVLRSGASYLPLDPGHTVDRLQSIAIQAGVRLVLVQACYQYSSNHERIALPSIIIRRSVTTYVAPKPKQILSEVTEVAYIIFTSGSTGKPKGVMITHQSAVNTIIDVNERFNISRNDRIFGASSLSFDLSVYDIFGTFAAGATLVIPPAGKYTSWAPFALRHAITVWNSVPALFSASFSRNELSVAARMHLRLVMLSGDWIPLELAKQLSELSNVTFVSFGGATEAAIWSIVRVVDAVDPSWYTVPYGKPMKNQSFRILDPYLEPCPVWVTGELYIGGIGVALGYVGDPRQTAETFLPDPVSGERLYRTGDYGRWLPSGEIEFQGRRDRQVKINGFRIELREIESVTASHPEVVEAAAIVRHAESGAKQLTVFFVAHSKDLLERHSLLVHMKKFLPPHMLPTSLIQVDKFPLTSNGKVDRSRLRNTFFDVEIALSQMEPLTSTQSALKQLWSRILKIDVSDTQRGFFDLGGDSLLMIAMQRDIVRLFGIDIEIVDMFKNPTLEKLSALIDQRRPSGPNERAQTQKSRMRTVQPDLARIRAERRARKRDTQW